MRTNDYRFIPLWYKGEIISILFFLGDGFNISPRCKLRIAVAPSILDINKDVLGVLYETLYKTKDRFGEVLLRESELLAVLKEMIGEHCIRAYESTIVPYSVKTTARVAFKTLCNKGRLKEVDLEHGNFNHFVDTIERDLRSSVTP
jgi:hypothetical protein